MKIKQTLARLISTTREKMGYSQSGLASRANIALEIIEGIESGSELFLPSTTRQKLAMALKLNPKKIKSLEKAAEDHVKDFETADKTEELKIKILEGKLQGNTCPACGAGLLCRVALMYDLEDNPVRHPKARCSKCPFQLK